jgi:DNA-binding XRE family transcriptional regulator
VCSVRNWERQRTAPEIRFIAPIIEFLGYDPLPQPESFAEKLKTYRLKQGLSQEKLAFKLGIDPATIGHWEPEEHRPTTKLRTLLGRYLSLSE